MKHLYAFFLACCAVCVASCTLLSKEDPELTVQILSFESGEVTHESAQVSISYSVQNQGDEPVGWGIAVAKTREEASDPTRMTPPRSVSGNGTESIVVSGLEPSTEYYAGAAIFVGAKVFKSGCISFRTGERPAEGGNSGE